MRIDLSRSDGVYLGRLDLPTDDRPTRVRLEETSRDAFLAWDGAEDDGGHLRTCIACDGGVLYKGRSFPQVTPVVVVLAFAGTAVALLGYATEWWILILLAAVLMLDVGVLILAQPRLTCYGCGTIYRRLTIARYHRSWDRSVAEREQGEPTSET